MNNPQPGTSKDDHFLDPNQNQFYRNSQPQSSASLKSTFSETNREPIDYNTLQDRYATQDQIRRPGPVDKIVSKVKSGLICCPADEPVSKPPHKSIGVIEVNIDETRSEIHLSKSNNGNDNQSKYGCSLQKLADTAGTLFPIVQSLRNYNMKTDFIKDLLAGITIAVFHIPQGKCCLLFTLYLIR